MSLQTIFLYGTGKLQNNFLLFLDSFHQYSKPFFCVFVDKLEVCIQTMQIVDVDGVIFG
jgi:hypothetical protein